MGSNISLNTVSTFVNDTTAVSTVNNNSTAITTAFTDVLSRSGLSPNQMTSNLDMNNNAILNLPTPVSPTSPVRVIDAAGNPTITVPPVGTSGATVPLLNANNTFSGNNIHSGTETFNNTVTFPSNTITSANLRQGVARSVIGVTGNATANEADIQGTTRQVLAVNTAGTGLVFAQPQGDQLLGTTTNDNATAGNVGEYISSTLVIGSAISLTAGVQVAVTSVSLTAGDWDVWVNAGFTGGATTIVQYLAASASTTSTSVVFTTPSTTSVVTANNEVLFGATNSLFVVGPVRFSLASTTTVYFNAAANFGTSTCSVFGTISARRVR